MHELTSYGLQLLLKDYGWYLLPVEQRIEFLRRGGRRSPSPGRSILASSSGLFLVLMAISTGHIILVNGSISSVLLPYHVLNQHQSGSKSGVRVKVSNKNISG